MVLIVLSIATMKIYEKNSKTFYILFICILLFGINTIFSGTIVVFPRILILIPKNILHISFLILTCTRFIIQVFLYGVIGYLFGKNNFVENIEQEINKV